MQIPENRSAFKLGSKSHRAGTWAEMMSSGIPSTGRSKEWRHFFDLLPANCSWKPLWTRNPNSALLNQQQGSVLLSLSHWTDSANARGEHHQHQLEVLFVGSQPHLQVFQLKSV